MFIAKLTLKLTPISEKTLSNVGFSKRGDEWIMGGLVIFHDKGYYHFDTTGTRVNIKNMQQISDLVYGITLSLDWSDGE